MSIFSTIAKGAATLGGNAYDYLTPGAGSSRVTKYGASQDRPAASPVPNLGNGSNSGGGGSATTPDLASIYNQAYAAAMAKSQTPAPRLVQMNSGQAWNTARDMATAAVSPIYQQKMTDFLNAQQVALSRQTADTTTAKQTADEALARQLADSETNRTRTKEDTTTGIQDINDAQAYSDRTEGLSYDDASRALSEGLGASGTAESGLGKGQTAESNLRRNTQSNEEVRQSTNKVAAANTLMNRTFDDLSTSDTRNTSDTTSKKASLDLDLSRFIEDQATAKDQESKQEELQKQADIASQTVTNEGQLVDQWLASLSGQGYTAQEIANAASIYK